MKYFAACFSFALMSSLALASSAKRPHMDLEMTGREYLALLEKNPVKKISKKNKMLVSSVDQEMEKYLAIGKRNLQWVDFVNQARGAQGKLSLSSPATSPGNSVQQPRTYNFKIIQGQWAVLESLLPASLKKVVFENAPFTTELGVSDREFIEWLFQVDAAYQITARYKMMLPYLEEMKGLAAYDIRGYVHLSSEEDLDIQLNDFTSLSDQKQTALLKDLLMLCLNSEKARALCRSELAAAVENKTLVSFKDQYLPAGAALYNGFFTLAGKRADGVWTAQDEYNMFIPFANPHNDAVLNYLKDNIEAEWRWKGWQLHLNFIESQDPTMTHIVWEEGATPHVDNAPGTTITMDQNSLLSEYDVQWTIRHEYGHVLGFPDCYHEFYDEELNAFVSYQLDVTNLMCSRRGKLKQTHFDELKRLYFAQ
jgi:hypothetical protein